MGRIAIEAYIALIESFFPTVTRELLDRQH
jgi:hypothetical protein